MRRSHVRSHEDLAGSLPHTQDGPLPHARGGHGALHGALARRLDSRQHAGSKSRPANFGNRGYPRAPYYDGDGKEDRILLAWGDGSCGRTGTGDLERIPRRTRSHILDEYNLSSTALLRRRHSLFCTGEGVILACGDGDDGQLGSKRLPPRPEGPEAKRERRRRIRRKLYGSDSSSDDPDAPPPLFTFSKTPEEAKEEALKKARKEQKRARRLKSAANLMTLKAKPMGMTTKKDKPKSLGDWFTTGNRHLLRYPRQTFPVWNIIRGLQGHPHDAGRVLRDGFVCPRDERRRGPGHEGGLVEDDGA